MEKSFDFGALLQTHMTKHKNKPVQFVSVAGGVKKRIESSIRYRKSTRFSVFDKIRNLQSPSPLPKPQIKVEHRRIQLEKWKEEKEKKKRDASLQKKKPFLVGVPHNSLKFVPPPPPKTMPSTSGRVTRSQSAKNNINIAKKHPKSETKSFAPKNAAFHPPVLKNCIKLPALALKKIDMNLDVKAIEKPSREPKSKKSKDKVSKQLEPTDLRNKLQSNKNHVTKTKKGSSSEHSISQSSSSVDSNNDDPPISKTRTPRKSWQGKQNNVTPKNVPKSESSSEEKLRSPKLIEIPMTPEQIADIAQKISPCVTLSRGKDNARKEMKKKIKEGLLDDDLCEIDSVEHFRRQLDSEIARMTEMCEVWEKILNQIVLPDSVQEAVLCAVGQARLLMSQKLQQFASLLSRCEHPAPNTALVTPTDLLGFWDMVFMQIENVDMRFRKLEELKARGWSEEPALPVSAPAPRPARPARPAAGPARPAHPAHPAAGSARPAAGSARPAAGPARPAAGPARPARPAASRLKDLIAAARRDKQAQPRESSSESKTLDMGFFCIQSPVKSTPPASSARRSLLQAVLANETEKSANRKSASYAMLRASSLGRHAEPQDSGEEPNLISFTPVDLRATPARSILKNKPSTKKSSKKSIKVVLFDDSDTDLQNTSINLDKLACDTDDKVLDLGTRETDHNADSGISSMDVEKENDKENKGRRKSKLTRQDALEDRSPVMTRSRRKSVQTPSQYSEKSTSRKKKTLKEVAHCADVNIQTPRRSSRKNVQGEV